MSKIKNNTYFSIVVPLFNKEEYVERAIQSILNQRYENFEIIIVNDGSIDRSRDKVIAINDARIKLIDQINKGVSAARNTGVFNAQYDFVTFLDADDTWEPNFLAEMDLLIKKFPDAGIYGVNNFFEYQNFKKVYEPYTWLFNGETCGLINNYFDVFLKIGKSPFSNSNFCMPKELFVRIDGYKEGVRLTEDSDLWSRVALSFKIAYSTKPLATYYMGTSGSTHFIFEKKDFHVTTTLKNELFLKNVIPKFEKSVGKFIAFQQLSLVKRSILTNHKGYARIKIFSKYIFKYYTLSFFIFFFVSLLPYKSIVYLTNKFKVNKI